MITGMSGGRRAGTRAALLVLTDGRLPAGGHAHSGGVEAAVIDGGVTDVDDLATFLLGRLGTAGLVAAAFAAAACQAARPVSEPPVVPHVTGITGTAEAIAPPRDALALLAALDAELDARTPSPAQRDASRAQGRTLLRAGRAAWDLTPYFPPSTAGTAGSTRAANTAGTRTTAAASPTVPAVAAPHHPIALGVVAAAAGLDPADAALAAVYGALGGPASAATRLLGLDPLAVTGLLARLAGAMEATAADAAAAADAALTAGRPDLLPAASAVRLDLLAERHRTAPVRMFTS